MFKKGPKPLCCDVCGGEFPNAITLKEHKRKHIKNRYKCSYCLQSFQCHRKCTEHMKTHVGDHPYECRICLDSFKTENYFRIHLKTHKKTTAESFVCDLCKKAFAHFGSLNRHRLTHSGSKPYPCLLCDKNFADVATRSRHVKNHVIFCGLCNQLPFKDYGDFKNHIEQMHIKRPEIDGKPNQKRCGSEKKLLSHMTESNLEHTSCGSLLQNEHYNKNNDFETCGILKIEQPSAASVMKYTEQITKISEGNNTFLNSGAMQNLPVDVSNECQTVLNMVHNPWIMNNNQFTPQNLTTAVIPVLMPTAPSLPFNPDCFIKRLLDLTARCKLLKYPIGVPLLTKINEVKKMILGLLTSTTGVFGQKQILQLLLDLNVILEKIIQDNMKYKLDHLIA